MHYVRPQCAAESRELPVGNIKFQASVPYDFTDLRIMHMTDSWKKVVFNLEVKTAKQPTPYFILHGEIYRGIDLVNRPFTFNTHRFNRRNEFCIFDNMCKLKDNGNDDTCHKYHDAVTDDRVNYT